MENIYKKVFFVIIIFFGIIVAKIYGLSPNYEYLIIENNLNHDIVVEISINAELIMDNNDISIFSGRTYFQEINNIPLIIYDVLLDNIITPNGRQTCIRYYPSGGLFYVIQQGYYDMLANINVMDKIKSLSY
jgi:hypothetical protein